MTENSGLSTRSYAILGLLAIRDWTTYELARQMQRGVGDIWTAARSMVYEEPKRLVALGLAQAVVEPVGRRTRTRYSITERGRAEVREWLSRPGAPPALQFEGLLKVLLAEPDDPESVLASLHAARRWADELTATGREVAQEYLAGRGPFPARAHLVSLSFAFLWDYAEFVRDWATRAEAAVASWSDTGTPAMEEPVMDVFRRALDAPTERGGDNDLPVDTGVARAAEQQGH